MTKHRRWPPLLALIAIALLCVTCGKAPTDPANDPAYRGALPGRSDQDESVFFEPAPK